MSSVEDKLNEIIEEIGKLRSKEKDSWDKFQIMAALFIPASIAMVGFLVSSSLKEAEIKSAQALAAGQQAVARTNSRVGQAALVKSFLDSLLSEDSRERKLAIEAMLIALPEDGPRLVSVVSETDPDPEVREFARMQQRVDDLLTFIDKISDESVITLNKDFPVQDNLLDQLISARDPRNLRFSEPDVARQILKMRVVYVKRDPVLLEALEKAIGGGI